MFTKAARKRMLDNVATLDLDQKCRFVTLTYSDCTIPDDGEAAKANLRALLERLRRAAPESSAVWRMELKPRQSGEFVGRIVPHFHLLVFGADHLESPTKGAKENYSGWFHEAWEAVTKHHEHYPDDGRHDLRTDDKKINGGRQAMYYVAKYAAKVDEEALLVTDAYPHVGRFWGVFQRDFLPSCPLREVAFRIHSEAFQPFREAACEIYPGIAQKRQNQGFTLYVDDAHMWLEFLEWCRQAYHPASELRETMIEWR